MVSEKAIVILLVAAIVLSVLSILMTMSIDFSGAASKVRSTSKTIGVDEDKESANVKIMIEDLRGVV